MKTTGGRGQRAKARGAKTVRASISFPTRIYQNLEMLAKQKKVSLAWVVRDAAERYVADEAAKAVNGRDKHDMP